MNLEEKIALAREERDFFQELHASLMQGQGDVIPAEVVERLNQLAGMMDRETQIIERLENE